MAGRDLLFDSLEKFAWEKAQDLAVRYCHEDPDFEDVSLYRPCDARVFIMGAYRQAAKDVYSWLQSQGSSASLTERSRAYTNPPEPDGCKGHKCGTCHLFQEGCVDLKLREAFEAGARSERRELLRWRDPAVEMPALPTPDSPTEWVEVLVEYVGNGAPIIEIGYNYGGPLCNGWFIRGVSDVDCEIKVIGWRPLLEE